jgi:L-threonylcarbamoyladenylate synthase
MSEVSKAVDILRRGGLVAFPTETVYGLGADATNADAVLKIFAAKGRPPTNPLIVHVSDVETARHYAARWPDTAEKLAAAFWPGPLTLVVPKRPEIPDVVTAGRPTVGLRVPGHPLALELLRAFGGPIAAPSANRSTRVSATIGRHVRDELGDAVDLVLEGGWCELGIESTVLDVSATVPRILRPGSVTREQIESVIGRVDRVSTVIDESVPADAPGQHAVHYAPQTPAYRFETAQKDLLRPPPRSVLIMRSFDLLEERGPWLSVYKLRPDPKWYAFSLYDMLRLADAENHDAIFIEMPPDTPEWCAVRDRLLRATKPITF